MEESVFNRLRGITMLLPATRARLEIVDLGWRGFDQVLLENKTRIYFCATQSRIINTVVERPNSHSNPRLVAVGIFVQDDTKDVSKAFEYLDPNIISELLVAYVKKLFSSETLQVPSPLSCPASFLTCVDFRQARLEWKNLPVWVAHALLVLRILREVYQEFDQRLRSGKVQITPVNGRLLAQHSQLHFEQEVQLDERQHVAMQTTRVGLGVGLEEP